MLPTYRPKKRYIKPTPQPQHNMILNINHAALDQLGSCSMQRHNHPRTKNRSKQRSKQQINLPPVPPPSPHMQPSGAAGIVAHTHYTPPIVPRQDNRTKRRSPRPVSLLRQARPDLRLLVRIPVRPPRAGTARRRATHATKTRNKPAAIRLANGGKLQDRLSRVCGPSYRHQSAGKGDLASSTYSKTRRQ